MIAEIQNPSEWQETLTLADHHDFYHTWDYHQISKSDGDIPMLIKYTEGNLLIVIPLLLKKISGNELYDATSVYCYAGPISRNVKSSFDNSQFHREFQNYLVSKRIISVFSRLNPFVPKQTAILKDIGNLIVAGEIVSVDLSQDALEQRKGYGRRLRTQRRHYPIPSRRHSNCLS